MTAKKLVAKHGLSKYLAHNLAALDICRVVALVRLPVGFAALSDFVSPRGKEACTLAPHTLVRTTAKRDYVSLLVPAGLACCYLVMSCKFRVPAEGRIHRPE